MSSLSGSPEYFYIFHYDAFFNPWVIWRFLKKKSWFLKRFIFLLINLTSLFPCLPLCFSDWSWQQELVCAKSQCWNDLELSWPFFLFSYPNKVQSSGSLLPTPDPLRPCWWVYIHIHLLLSLADMVFPSRTSRSWVSASRLSSPIISSLFLLRSLPLHKFLSSEHKHVILSPTLKINERTMGTNPPIQTSILCLFHSLYLEIPLKYLLLSLVLCQPSFHGKDDRKASGSQFTNVTPCLSLYLVNSLRDPVDALTSSSLFSWLPSLLFLTHVCPLLCLLCWLIFCPLSHACCWEFLVGLLPQDTLCLTVPPCPDGLMAIQSTAMTGHPAVPCCQALGLSGALPDSRR